MLKPRIVRSKSQHSTITNISPYRILKYNLGTSIQTSKQHSYRNIHISVAHLMTTKNGLKTFIYKKHSSREATCPKQNQNYFQKTTFQLKFEAEVNITASWVSFHCGMSPNRNYLKLLHAIFLNLALIYYTYTTLTAMIQWPKKLIQVKTRTYSWDQMEVDRARLKKNSDYIHQYWLCGKKCT